MGKNYKLQNMIRQMPQASSPLDIMVDGKEYESILKYKFMDFDIAKEIRKALKEVSVISNKPIVAYFANVINQKVKASISIDSTDELPFTELVSPINSSNRELDFVLVTPGGSAEQVSKFVNKLRPRFDTVRFILPNIAMSAGSIFVMSGDEIIMTPDSYIGPIDPQVPGKDGRYIPAQSILTLINDIQQRGSALLAGGQQPLWTDLQILNNIDGKEIGAALNASGYSIELVKDYLTKYKFGAWDKHRNGMPVTEQEKQTRAIEIASRLCDHSIWKTHSRGITREIAWEECRLKILHAESIAGLERAIRRLWALMYWIFENTAIYKILISEEYAIFRNDPSLINR